MGGGNASASAYLTDALDIFDQGGCAYSLARDLALDAVHLHSFAALRVYFWCRFPWTQWIWRGETSDCQTYNVVCQPVSMLINTGLTQHSKAFDELLQSKFSTEFTLCFFVQVACGAYHAQMSMVRPLRKYLGGAGPLSAPARGG